MNKRQADSFASPIDEIRAIVERNLFPIFAGMISSEFFSSRQEPGGANDYLRLKELLGIDRGFKSSALASVRDFERRSPKRYRHITRELEYQVAINVLRRRYRLYDAVFMGTGLLLNASPLARAEIDPNDLEDFVNSLERGHISFE
jgi:hypothetical protein